MTKELLPLIMAELLKCEKLSRSDVRRIAEHIAESVTQHFHVTAKPPSPGRRLASYQEGVKRMADEQAEMIAAIDRMMGYERSRGK